MERYKLEQICKGEEYNYNGYVAFVLFIAPIIFGAIVIGVYKLISWLVQIGG